MSKAFTLIELLVVVSIMGLLGTAAVGGYRQMQRGMEERGVIDSVTRFVELASQRAQIDHMPTAVYYWNEMLREEDDLGLQTEIVVGKAVAVRSQGRVSSKKGSRIYDEFGDLEKIVGDKFADVNDDETVYPFYHLNENTGEVVPLAGRLCMVSEIETTLLYDPRLDLGNDNSGDDGEITRFGYELTSGGSDMKIGSIYGMEFQSLTLPHGYVFGEVPVPTSINSPKGTGRSLFFDAESTSAGNARGSATILVSSLRPGSGGALSVQQVGRSEAPRAKLNE